MSARAAPLRRGWCPSALRPMATGDGLLARASAPGGRLDARQLALVARLARRHGNGLIDLTSRANIQIRGVSPATHPALAEALAEAGLAAPNLTLASPLAGRDGAEALDSAALAAATEAALATVSGLPPKALVTVDGGGALGLDEIAADCSLRVVPGRRDSAAAAVLLGLPGGLRLGPVAPAEAPALAAALMAGLAARHGEAPDRVRRMRDIPAGDLKALAARLGLAPSPAPPARPAPRPVGPMAERGGTCAVLAAAPFGRLDAARLGAVAALAEDVGAADIRLTPFRGLALTGLAEPDAILSRLDNLGLIVEAGDPRLAVHACPGAPACAQGEAPAQADAARLARALSGRIAQGLRLHVSGCAKGCAHPGAADVTLVGRDGLYDVVLSGRAQDAPEAEGLPAHTVAARLAAPGDLRLNLSRTLP